MDAADILLTEVRQLVRDRGIDPLRDAARLEALVAEVQKTLMQ